MCLLKKGVPFTWDDQAQLSFDALKDALETTPLIHPLHYTRDYILYLASSTSTIGIVLVQEDDDGTEHVVYYVSKSLLDTHMSRSWIWNKLLLFKYFVTISYFERPLSLLMLTPCITF